jgi:protein-tyrosine-phosphatase
VNIVTLCTGNVARSVMLGYMLTTLAEVNGEHWHVRSAGTHVIEGSAMSARTRSALMAIDELGEHHFNAHRSHQLDDSDVLWADLILTSEADHVRYVRNCFPDASHKAVQLGLFARAAPVDGPFEHQLRAVATREPLKEYDVADPAGGDQVDYDRCATQLWELAQVFATLVGDA